MTFSSPARHTVAQLIRRAVVISLASALAACSSSHGADDAGTLDAAAADAAIADASTGDDAAITDAALADANVGEDATVVGDGGVSPCEGLGAAACFANVECSAVFDDACCPDCTDGPCADCVDYTYFGCRPFEGCREACGHSPSWACYPTAPDCTGATPTDSDSCDQTGCVPAVAPIGALPLMDTCVPITGDSCTVACRRVAPNCPAGTVPEGDGSCYTDRCIPAFVCLPRVD